MASVFASSGGEITCPECDHRFPLSPGNDPNEARENQGLDYQRKLDEERKAGRVDRSMENQ